MLSAGYLDLDSLKTRILPAGAVDISDWDSALQSLGKGVAAAMSNACNRELHRATAAVYECSAANLTATLRRYPVEEITQIELYDPAGTLRTYAGEYTLAKFAGLIDFPTPPSGPSDILRVTYTGGYWINDGTTLPTGASEMPYDIIEAFVIQCQVWAEARNLFGTSGLQGEVDKKPADRTAALRLAPEVLQILAPYRRFSNE